jgi:anti-sigma regulatory factor (Ser/Thr protein kinase)
MSGAAECAREQNRREIILAENARLREAALRAENARLREALSEIAENAAKAGHALKQRCAIWRMARAALEVKP